MLTETDIEDMRTAMAVLTREELELFALDRAIKAHCISRVLNPRQVQQFTEKLNETPLSFELAQEMNRVMDIVTPYLDIS